MTVNIVPVQGIGSVGITFYLEHPVDEKQFHGGNKQFAWPLSNIIPVTVPVCSQWFID